MNDALKELGEMCGIDAPVSYHPLPTTLRINQLQKESTKTGTKTMQVGGFLQYNLINHIIL